MSFLKKYNRKSWESQSSNQSTALNQSLFSSNVQFKSIWLCGFNYLPRSLVMLLIINNQTCGLNMFSFINQSKNIVLSQPMQELSIFSTVINNKCSKFSPYFA